MGKLQNLYDKSPYVAQHVLLNLYACRIHVERYGKPFHAALEELTKTQWYTPDEIAAYQLERLKKIVKHAYETVPFYRKRFDEYQVRPIDIKNLSDVAKLPILTREDVRSAGDQLISSKYPQNKLFHGHTSGTTGSPLSCYWDKHTCIYNNAADWRQKIWAGVQYGDGIAMFLGRTIVPTNKTSPPLWQHDRIHNMLWMSSFHLSEQYLPYHLEKLRSFQPAAIEGYPSTTFILARYLKKIGQKLPLKAVLTSSETLLPQQRELIEESFEAPVFDFYGMAERVAFASQCAEAHEYHLNFEFALNEVVDNNGFPVEQGKEGYLVGTSLLNFGMPFIRYQTSDITALDNKQCACGRYMPRFKGITTKDEDIVVTPEGKLVSSSVLTHPFKPLDAIEESQIIQEKIDLLHIKIVRSQNYKDSDSAHLISALHERVGTNMKIELEFVESIPRTKSGKFRWVISKVPLPL
ncbi:phenylacetate--CoA ligase family protein [Pelovirga terrestris]|uniref:Phenylacetate--CoA ligase family protein n=1 Tax=Pelovirga terrestris TaxID=2771352 RepID=A0A8J6UHH9_9BACT|nr:phenylacetate--CoA ligase family protein [Pelovirga terrestris]MBD1399330.1 phenylacetate--CoA ligase family protein [Pelovirga terrestris]